MHPHDPVTQDDLNGYIDGQLHLHRQAEVEQWLADHPEAAARVMADKGLSDLLRIGFPTPEPTPLRQAVTDRLARQLGRRLLLRRMSRGMQRGLAACLLIAAGWALNWVTPGFTTQADAALRLPVFADEALDAYRTAMRERTADRTLTYAEIATPAQVAAAEPGASIPMPSPPGKGWRFLGAQLVPWDNGDAVQAFWRDKHGDLLVLFATEDTSEAPREVDRVPQIVTLDGRPMVYWRTGTYAYAVTGTVSRGKLLRFAANAGHLASPSGVAPPPQPSQDAKP